MDLSRRALLGTAWAGLSASACGYPVLAGQTPRRGARPKNIIFCVVDGMPISAMTLVDHLRQLREGKPSYWAWLYDQPFTVNGLQDTRSLNSVVTDSSAASSAWGCGRRIWNGMVNMFPDRTPLRTLTSLMAEKGVKCGLATTSTMTHATPAGFAVSCVQRDREPEIAELYLRSGVDVLLGGGGRFFDPARRTDKKDLYAEYERAGYRVCKTKAELLGGKSDKILGIFSSSHVPYSVDRAHDAGLRATVPTLAEMSRVAIDTLYRTGSKNGFLLQIEGARVDHGAHGNDLAAMIFDQIAFEEAVQVAIEFAMSDGETLVVVTSDHACGGMALNGAGDEYIESTAGLRKVLGMKSSFGPVLADIGSPTVEKVRGAVEARLGIQLAQAEAEGVVRSMRGDHPFQLSHFYRSVPGTLGMVLGNHTKVTFTSGNHHSDHVLVTAYGPGSEQCAGLTPNTSFFDRMAEWKGIRHRNPEMSFATAAPLYEKLKGELAAERPPAIEEVEDEFQQGHRALA